MASSRWQAPPAAFHPQVLRIFAMTRAEKQPKRVSSSRRDAVRRQLGKEGLDLFEIASIKGDHAFDQNFPSGKQRTAWHRSE